MFGPGWSTTTPRSRSVSAMTRTSSISGTFVKRQRSPVSVAAANSFRAAFFDPLIETLPRSGTPPSIRNTSRATGSGVNSQWNGLASAMNGHPQRSASARPPRCKATLLLAIGPRIAVPRALAVATLRKPLPEERLLEGGTGHRQVGTLVVTGLERLLGLAACLLRS